MPGGRGWGRSANNGFLRSPLHRSWLLGSVSSLVHVEHGCANPDLSLIHALPSGSTQASSYCALCHASPCRSTSSRAPNVTLSPTPSHLSNLRLFMLCLRYIDLASERLGARLLHRCLSKLSQCWLWNEGVEVVIAQHRLERKKARPADHALVSADSQAP